MIALLESTESNDIKIVSAQEDDRLRSQIEKILGTALNSTTWAKLYVDMEPVDLGYYSITLFATDSLLDIKPLPIPPLHVRVYRDSHNLKPL